MVSIALRIMLSSLANERRDTLIRVAQYVFRRESQELRDDLNDNLLETVLYLRGRRGVTKAEIPISIEQEFGIKDFPWALIDQSLDRLMNVKKRVKVENGRYILFDSRIKEIENVIKRKKEILKSMESKLNEILLRRYRKQPDRMVSDLIIQLFYEFLALLFILRSDLISDLLSFSKGEKIRAKLKAPLILLDEMLTERCKDDEIREAFRDSVFELFSKLDEDTLICLGQIAQNFVYIKLLNIDPECRFIVKEALSQKTLLLDTNIIISFLLPTHVNNQFTVKLIELTKQLGVKILYTTRTEAEYFDVLDEANKAREILEPIKASLLGRTSKAFIRSYATAKVKLPSLTWDGFYYEMRQLGSKLGKIGIGIFEDKELRRELQQEKELLDKTKSWVDKCALSVGNIKSDSVIEHDAYHLLLIRKLREKEESDMLGPQYWFLTYDTSLFCVDQKINEETAKYSDPPSSMIAELWLTFLTPFLGPDVANIDLPRLFGELMKTSLALLPAEIPLDLLVEIEKPWLNYEALDEEDIEAILGDKVVQEYIKQAEMLRKKGDARYEEVKKSLREVVSQKTSDLLNKRAISSKKAKEESERIAMEERKKMCRVIFGLSVICWVVAIFLCHLSIVVPAVVLFGAGSFGFVLALRYGRLRWKIGEIEVEAEEK
jgi:hypothetical protein